MGFLTYLLELYFPNYVSSLVVALISVKALSLTLKHFQGKYDFSERTKKTLILITSLLFFIATANSYLSYDFKKNIQDTFQKAPARVTSLKMKRTYRAERNGKKECKRIEPEVTFTYSVNYKQYNSKVFSLQRSLFKPYRESTPRIKCYENDKIKKFQNKFKQGSRQIAYYDPQNPKLAILYKKTPDPFFIYFNFLMAVLCFMWAKRVEEEIETKSLYSSKVSIGTWKDTSQN